MTTDDIQPYTLILDTEQTQRLSFEGCLLGEVSTWRPTKRYWTEIRGWRTRAGKLVVQTIGRSMIEEEDDRIRTGVFDTETEMTRKMGWTSLNASFWSAIGIREVSIA